MVDIVPAIVLAEVCIQPLFDLEIGRKQGFCGSNYVGFCHHPDPNQNVVLRTQTSIGALFVLYAGALHPLVGSSGTSLGKLVKGPR